MCTFAAGRRWQWGPSFVHLGSFAARQWEPLFVHPCSFAVSREFFAAVRAFLCTCHRGGSGSCPLYATAEVTSPPRAFWRLPRLLQLGLGLLRRPLPSPRLLRRLVLWELWCACHLEPCAHARHDLGGSSSSAEAAQFCASTHSQALSFATFSSTQVPCLAFFAYLRSIRISIGILDLQSRIISTAWATRTIPTEPF